MKPNADHAHALLTAANQLLEQGHPHAARATWHAALGMRGDMISAHAQLALSYAHAGEHVAALPHAQQWALLAPTDAQAHWLLAQLLRAHNRLPESIVQARKLLRLAPSWQGLDLFLAKLYLDTRQMSLATPHFETALDTSKDDATQHASVQWEYAMQLLTLSEYERGWRYYNSRFNVFGATELNCCPLPAALWQGESLADKVIVIHGEQGIGDEVMFTSMVPDVLAQHPKQCILAVHPALLELMRNSFPSCTVVAHTRGAADNARWLRGQLPDWWHDLTQETHVDHHIPMGNLPNLLRRQRSDFPKIPHIVIDANRVETMSQALKQQAAAQAISLTGKRLIALAWCGNLDNPHGRAKSLQLAQLATLKNSAAQHNIVFVSLQNAQYGTEARTQTALPIIDMSAHTDDFADTLALAAQCEHVLTIDTSYFHVCAAAGLPVWLVLREKCDWRNGWQRSDYDWYESVELIRQNTDGDWSNVFETLRERLILR